MKKSDEYSEPKQAAHVKYMVENAPKREKINRPISAAQALYDNRDKDPKAYEAYLNRPMVTKEMAQVLDSKGKVDVGHRDIPVEDIIAHENMRRSSKNTLGDGRDTGEPSWVKGEIRDRAISAFTCSPPATPNEAEIDRLIKMLEYTPPVIIEEKKETRLERFFKKIGIGKKEKPSEKAPDLFKALGGSQDLWDAFGKKDKE